MTRSLFVLLAAAAAPLSLFAGCAPTRSADASPARPSADTAQAAPAAAGPTGPAKAYPKPPEAVLESRLTPLQFEVTQRAATEPPFQNAYWNNHEAGLYVDVATGEPLFSSRDKFESGTGWPSFTRPVEGGHVLEHHDDTLGMARVEVVSKSGASHLGHVFDDGPAPSHMRYCINSAALRFIPASQLAAQGYGEYAPSFGLPAPAEAPAAAASNSCTLPPPGKTPGCKATLETAIFAPAPGDEKLARTPGILEVARGHEGKDPAVEVTYDPAKLTYEALITAWTAGRPAAAHVYTRSDAQKQVAAGKALKTSDAVPFQRD